MLRLSSLVPITLALLAWLIPGCSQAATAIVVVVESDMTVPSELASVHVEVGGTACSDSSCTHDFPLATASAIPFSFAITPQGGGGALALVVRGRDPSSVDRVVRSVSTSFVTGRTLLLVVRLERACIDNATCSGSNTCIAGTCVSDLVDPSTLRDVMPGAELFRDAGTSDASEDAGEDARDTGDDANGPHDGGNDAANDTNTIPRTCADIPSTTPSGTYLIDPDGPGGRDPFLDYCETSADGGGWTLIAKVDPSTTTLTYSAAAWMVASDSGHFGTPDLTVGNALLPSYWAMQVSDVRFVMAPVATPTETQSLTATLSAALAIRVAMEPSAHVTMTVTSGSWTTLIGASHTLGVPTCELAGIPAELPTTTPIVHVRIGYVWSDTNACGNIGFWAGLGAEGAGCRPVASVSGGGRMCGTGTEREDLPRAAWLFAR